MSDDFEYFMVFEMDESGEKIRLDITLDEFVEDNGRNVLHSEQVVIIVKEDIRRIFIWKGAKSPVRKRFISSRAASALQDQLQKDAAFHRCKIVSVDQGDEVQEFLNAFRFESMEADEKLADMKYIRNIDRDKMLESGETIDQGPKVVKIEPKPKTKEREHVSPALKEMQKTTSKRVTTPVKRTTVRSTYKPQVKRSTTPQISDGKENEIKEKILKEEVPKGYKRQNLIMGYTLYGAVYKKVNVFGKSIEEVEWTSVDKVPKGMIEIDKHKIRIYFDEKQGIVEAIEVLVNIDHNVEKKPAAKKSPAAKKKLEPRSLPKIPSGED